MKGIIVYKGKYNTTRQYAGWISSALGIPAVMADQITGENLRIYDFVILGSSVYIGKLQIRNWLKQNAPALLQKKIFMFVVCGTPPNDKEAQKKIISDNLSEELRNKSDIYFLRGRVIRKELSTIDRMMLKMGSMMVRDKAARKRMTQDFDGVKEENIFPLLNAIRNADLDQKANTRLSGASCQIRK